MEFRAFTSIPTFFIYKSMQGWYVCVVYVCLVGVRTVCVYVGGGVEEMEGKSPCAHSYVQMVWSPDTPLSLSPAVICGGIQGPHTP